VSTDDEADPKNKKRPKFTMVSSSDEVRPFEWLTSASSIDRPLTEALKGMPDQEKRVLHIGCGSSILGEYLLQERKFCIKEVVNADKDGDTLDMMRQRWDSQRQEHDVDSDHTLGSLEFLQVDFCAEPIAYPDHYFDLVVDKSTLDCTLCSDKATASLLGEIHRLLKPGGVYLLISFHHIDLLRPVLEDCPGADWDVTHSVMMRQVEDLISSTGKAAADYASQVDVTTLPLPAATDFAAAPCAWSSGCFEPDEMYRRTVNALQCRRHQSDGNNDTANSALDLQAVCQHIKETNDHWFQITNPMVTTKRKEELQQAFQQSAAADQLLDLPQSFQALFTDAERENLTYEYFLEDWHAFGEKHTELPVDRISYETAVCFLDEMQ
jgi:SAM-dependent methyltransferase